MGFTDKVALIAGGTGGLGRAVSVAFLRAGARVAVTYRKQEEFAQLQSAAGSMVPALTGQAVDITNEPELRSALDNILQKHTRIDILVNAVGAYAGGLPLWETAANVWDEMFQLNLYSGVVLARTIVPIMLTQSSGCIVNVASKAAADHAAGAAAYVASKAAAVAMMDSLAEDLRGSGVRVNSVLPSIIDTRANRQAMPNADFSKWPKPDDIARVILFLCSEDASLIHGGSIPVYGTW